MVKITKKERDAAKRKALHLYEVHQGIILNSEELINQALENEALRIEGETKRYTGGKV